MKDTDITLLRNTHGLKSTIGHLYLGSDSEKFCYTLEDVIRGKGVKIYGETGIPEGEYFWHITYSGKFKRDMISIYTQSNGYQIIANGIEFKGVRFHGGNRSKDSHGCPLVAFNKIDNDTIYKTAEKKLLEWAKFVGGSGRLIVKN